MAIYHRDPKDVKNKIGDIERNMKKVEDWKSQIGQGVHETPGEQSVNGKILWEPRVPFSSAPHPEQSRRIQRGHYIHSQCSDGSIALRSNLQIHNLANLPEHFFSGQMGSLCSLGRPHDRFNELRAETRILFYAWILGFCLHARLLGSSHVAERTHAIADHTCGPV